MPITFYLAIFNGVHIYGAKFNFSFWNTGEEKFAKQALANDFIDLNLPKGRKQGKQGTDPIELSAIVAGTGGQHCLVYQTQHTIYLHYQHQ
jgi:hypothetical protein